jgi:hypothetical protein
LVLHYYYRLVWLEKRLENLNAARTWRGEIWLNLFVRLLFSSRVLKISRHLKNTFSHSMTFFWMILTLNRTSFAEYHFLKMYMTL